MKEIACQFGENQRLSGIFTHSSSTSTKKALVLVSVGFIGKYGPFRIYTSIARRAAELGFDAFRFDLGSIGNSQPGDLTSSLKIRTNKEICSALDYLQTTYGIEQFVLGGLCSGAENSYRYAEEDPRVVGLIMIDPFAYRTRGYLLHDLKNRVIKRILHLINPNAIANAHHNPNPNYCIPTTHRSAKRKLTPHNFMLRSWRKLVQILFFNLAGEERKKPPTQTALHFIEYQLIPSDESGRILKILLERNVALHFIYTTGRIDYFNHKSQLWEMFPELKKYPRVKIDYFPQIEHTQMLEEDRRLLFEAIDQGLIKNFNNLTSN